MSQTANQNFCAAQKRTIDGSIDRTRINEQFPFEVEKRWYTEPLVLELSPRWLGASQNRFQRSAKSH